MLPSLPSVRRSGWFQRRSRGDPPKGHDGKGSVRRSGWFQRRSHGGDGVVCERCYVSVDQVGSNVGVPFRVGNAELVFLVSVDQVGSNVGVFGLRLFQRLSGWVSVDQVGSNVGVHA